MLRLSEETVRSDTMKGHNVKEVKRSKWEQEMYETLYEQKLENERIKKSTRMLEYVCMVVIGIAIVLIFLMNRANGYLF